MLTFRTTTPRTCGIVEIDENNIIINYHEKSELDFGNLANGAVYILSKECLLNIYSNFKHSIDFSNDILPNLISKIYTYETGKMYLDIGTPESYKFANEF
jgi:mannose-1-phosphate guanylyltransferase